NNSVTDGVYVGANDATNTATFPTTGLFQDCTMDYAFRNNMSIINAWGVQVIGGSYTKAAGTWAQDGIDIEPNPGSAQPGVKDVTIRGAKFTGNRGFGTDFVGEAKPINILAEQNYFKDNWLGAVSLGSSYTTVRNNLMEYFSHLSVDV